MRGLLWFGLALVACAALGYWHGARARSVESVAAGAPSAVVLRGTITTPAHVVDLSRCNVVGPLRMVTGQAPVLEVSADCPPPPGLPFSDGFEDRGPPL